MARTKGDNLVGFPAIEAVFSSIGLHQVANIIMTIRGPAGHLTNEIAVLPIPHNAVEGEFDRASLRLGREILQWVNNSAKDVWDEDKALRRLGQSVLDGRSKRDQ